MAFFNPIGIEIKSQLHGWILRGVSQFTVKKKMNFLILFQTRDWVFRASYLLSLLEVKFHYYIFFHCSKTIFQIFKKKKPFWIKTAGERGSISPIELNSPFMQTFTRTLFIHIDCSWFHVFRIFYFNVNLPALCSLLFFFQTSK